MNNNGKQKNMLKHGLGMMVCCMLPILLIAILPLIGVKAAWLSSLTALICPLGMIFMMFGMGHSHDDSSCHQSKDESLRIEEKK